MFFQTFLVCISKPFVQRGLDLFQIFIKNQELFMSMDYNSFLPGNMSDENQILQNLRPSKARKTDGFFPGMCLGATTMVN